MPKKQYVAALKELLRAEGIADDVVRDMLRNMSTFHGNLRSYLKGANLHINEVNRIMREFEALSAEFSAQMLGGLPGTIEAAYIDAIAHFDQLLMAFEYGLAPGIAVLPGEMAAFQTGMTFDLIKDVTAQMITACRTEVMQGIMLQRRPFQVMQRITNIVGLRDLAGFREIGTTGVSAKAERIVRTEMMGTMNMAHHERMQQVGDQMFKDLKKVWMATGDHRCRDEHLDAHGQIVPYNGNFEVGGEPCQFPVDPGLSPGMRINCRCRSVPYREEWGPIEDLTGLVDASVEKEKLTRAGPPPELSSSEEMKSFEEKFKAWREGDMKSIRAEIRAIRRNFELERKTIRERRQEIKVQMDKLEEQKVRLKLDGPIARKQYMEVQAEWEKLDKLRSNLLQDINDREREAIIKILKPDQTGTIGHDRNPQQRGVNKVKQWTTDKKKRIRGYINDSMPWLNDMIPVSWLDRDPLNPGHYDIPWRYQTGWRSHYSPSLRMIEMGYYADRDTFIHEVGHVIDDILSPQVRNNSISFLLMRAERESNFTIINVGSAAKPEWAYNAGFKSKYCGRFYAVGMEWSPSAKGAFDVGNSVNAAIAAGSYTDFYATEITSMGIEFLWQDPMRFMTKQPEYFDFIVGLIKGGF